MRHGNYKYSQFHLWGKNQCLCLLLLTMQLFELSFYTRTQSISTDLSLIPEQSKCSPTLLFIYSNKSMKEKTYYVLLVVIVVAC